jgi:hypothetical protein
MSEMAWQPARLVNFHKRGSEGAHAPIVDTEKHKTVLKRVVRIKEAFPITWSPHCDAKKIFLIHPDDCGCINAHVCEHEILTD